MEFPIEVPSEFVGAAEHWHDGQASALYSVASTGTIDNPVVLSDVARELRYIVRNWETKFAGKLFMTIAQEKDVFDVIYRFLACAERIENDLPEEE